MSDIDTDDGNIILNYKNLKRLLDPHLANCDICKTSKLVVHRVTISSICQKLRLTCPSCYSKNRTLKRSIRHLNKKMPELHKSERKKMMRQLNNKTKIWNTIVKPSLRIRELDLDITSYFEANCSFNNAVQYDINTRLFMSPFLTGTGFEKATGILACLNVEGSVGSNRTFYNHQALLTANIIKTTTAVIQEAQAEEIKANILEKLVE